MTNLTNLYRVNPSENEAINVALEDVFSDVFDKPIISVGSFVRKVHVLLMGLCDVTGGLWSVTLKYDEKLERFRFVIVNIERGNKFEIICSLSSGVNYAGAMDAVKKSFLRDKMAKHAVSWVKTVIAANTNEYTYEKKLLNDNTDIAVWIMHTNRLPWYKRLSKLFSVIEPGNRVVSSINVVDYAL